MFAGGFTSSLSTSHSLPSLPSCHTPVIAVGPLLTLNLSQHSSAPYGAPTASPNLAPILPTSAVPDAQTLLVLSSIWSSGVRSTFQCTFTSHRLSAQSFNTSGTSNFTKFLQPQAFHFQFHNFPLDRVSPHLVSPKQTEPSTTHPQHASPVHAHSMSMSPPDPLTKGHGNQENTFLLSWHPYRELSWAGQPVSPLGQGNKGTRVWCHPNCCHVCQWVQEWADPAQICLAGQKCICTSSASVVICSSSSFYKDFKKVFTLLPNPISYSGYWQPSLTWPGLQAMV